MHRLTQELAHLRWRFQLGRERFKQHINYLIWRLRLALDRSRRLGSRFGFRDGWPLAADRLFNPGLRVMRWLLQPIQTALRLAMSLGNTLSAAWNTVFRALPSLNRVSLVVKTAVIGSILLIAALAIEPYALSDWIWPSYVYDHERLSGAALVDANGLFLGYIPGHFESQADFSMGVGLPADHKAIRVENPPPVWRAVLYALEDRHHDTWRSLHGIDLIAIVRAMTRDLFGGQRISGASSLSMMLVRSMRHEAPDADVSWVDRIRRKLIEVRDGPILHHNLSAVEFDRWLAMHLPLVQGTIASKLGAGIYGLEAAGQVLFCRGADQLTLGQQAILAAAVKQPILISPHTDPDIQNGINTLWERHKTRARYGLQHSGLAVAVIAQAVSELAQLPPPTPCVPPMMASILPNDPKERFKIVADPARRAMYTLGFGGLAEVIGELQETQGYYWRRTVSTVALTLDGIANSRFQNAIKKTLPGIERSLAGRLQQPLQIKKDEAQTAIVLVAVADEQGRLVRFFSNRFDSIYVGGRHLRDEQGHYQHERETRRIASLGKLPLALLLAERGDPWNQWVYCNRAFASIANPDGNTGVNSCRAPRAYYRPVEAFGASLNLPLLDASKNLKNSEILTLFEQFALHYDPAVGPPYLALTLGRVTANPRTVQHMTGTLYAALLNRPAPDALPHLTTLRASSAMTSPAITGSPTPALSRYLNNPKRLEFLWRTLSAALEPAYRGTLSALARYRTNPGRQIRIAKTGTSTTDEGIQDRWALAGFWVDGKPYTAIVLVGSSDSNQPLGSGLNGNQLLAPLIKVALESL